MDIQIRGRAVYKMIAYALVLLMLWLGGVVHAGTVTYVYTDAQGTPLAEADASGNITATFDYAPYGSQALGTPPSGPGYTGHVNDPESGLVYMQARYYDPAVGRFLSADPVGPSPGSMFHFNRYDYANNNPTNHTDPDGRAPDTDFGLGAMARSAGQYPDQMKPALPFAIAAAAGEIGAGEVLVGAVKWITKAFTHSSSSKPKLTNGQAKNLARFEKKFSKANRNVQISHGKDGTITMKNDVPGKVPGSKAVYEKTVDSSGKTISATKTTYDPKGNVVHVKDKLSQ
ncbi:MAG: RHS repeat-associated core domain-containing protein [Rhodanobacter lindaniclasticus]